MKNEGVGSIFKKKIRKLIFNIIVLAYILKLVDKILFTEIDD